MKFCIVAYDTSFALGKSSGAINGGTAWLWHIQHTLQAMGHEAFMVDNGSYIPDADVVIIQSEWYGTQGQPERFKAMRKNGTKLVVILGHFIGGVYYNPYWIEADVFVSTWKGPVIDNNKHKVKFWPHAYCDVCDKEGSERKGDVIWVGNNYPLRNEGWFDRINVTKVQGIMPDELGKLYRGSQICINLHGSFQKGEVSTLPSTLATEPGFACNERLFQVCGAGGFQIADDNPQIREFYTEEEVVCAKDAEDFKGKIDFYLDNPEARQKFVEKAKERTMCDHTYRKRCENLISWINE